MPRTSIGSQTITIIPLATGGGGIIYKEFVIETVTSPAQSGYVALNIGTAPAERVPVFTAEFSTSKFSARGSSDPIENATLTFAGTAATGAGSAFGLNGYVVVHLPRSNSPTQNTTLLPDLIQVGNFETSTDSNGVEINGPVWAWASRIKPGSTDILEIRDPRLGVNESLSIDTLSVQHSDWSYENILPDTGGVESTQAVARQVFDKGDIVQFDDTYFIYDGANRLITDEATAFPVDGDLWEQISDSTDRFVHAFNNWNGRIAYKKDNIVTYNGLFIRLSEYPDWVSGQAYPKGSIVAYDGVLFERNIVSADLVTTPVLNDHWIAFVESMVPSIDNSNWETLLTAALAYTKVEVDGLINSWADYAIGGVYIREDRNLSNNGLIITLDYAGGRVFREILDDGSLDGIYNTNTDGLLTDLLKTRGG